MNITEKVTHFPQKMNITEKVTVSTKNEYYCFGGRGTFSIVILIITDLLFKYQGYYICFVLTWEGLLAILGHGCSTIRTLEVRGYSKF